MRYSLRFVGILVAAAGTVAAVSARPAAAPAPLALVLCAPGFPGSTEEAQSAMNTLAGAVSTAAGWKAGELTAIYFETEKAGLDRLRSADAAIALTPLPFYLQHRVPLRLEALMQAVEQGGGAAEAWTLVAGTGLVSGPQSLAGFELVTVAGYAPRFVRGPALAAWGELPRDLKVTPSSAVLSALRRASTGAKVALLLDRAQAAALGSLPFASKLQVVTKSAPLPVSVLASVGDRLPPSRRTALLKVLASLGSTPAGAEALAGVRLTGFVAADHAALTRARDAFDRIKE